MSTTNPMKNKPKWTGYLYRDIYGAVWKRLDGFYVRRLNDGNIGGWFCGDGLTKIKLNK